MTYDVIAIGSATRDILMKSEGGKVVDDKDFPSGKGLCIGFGSKIEIKKIVFATGGGGANAAVTFGRQGLKAACIGVIGDDFNGRDILEQLGAQGVDTDYFQKHDDDYTAYSVIMVGDNAERTILSYKGEGQHFDLNKIPFGELKAKWVYLDSLGGNFDLLQGAVNWAVENGIKLATNPGGKELAHGLEKLQPLLKHFSMVMTNQEEAAGLTGIDYKDEAGIFKKMDELIDGIFVMTKGPEGVVASDGKQLFRAGIPDSPVVERTGAGDAFNSGFLAEYIRSGDIIKAIQFGTANSTAVVQEYGATAGILKKDDWGKYPLVEVSVSTP